MNSHPNDEDESSICDKFLYEIIKNMATGGKLINEFKNKPPIRTSDQLIKDVT